MQYFVSHNLNEVKGVLQKLSLELGVPLSLGMKIDYVRPENRESSVATE